jgi:DNA mismatch repair protein MSH6
VQLAWSLVSSHERFPQLVFLYKLVEGAAASSFGTHVASLAGVPASVVQRADGVSKDFAKKMEERHSTKRSQILPLMSQADFALLHRLASSENLAGNQSGLLALGTIRGIVQASA